MAHEVPALGYSYDALEPHIDAQTMEIHHTKHHAAYVAKLNAALETYPELLKKEAEQLIQYLDELPEDIRTAVRNNGGGHVNHSFFWPLLKKGVEEKGVVVDMIVKQWGGLDAFKEEFNKAATTRFGSGWAWLVLNKDKELEITSTANQDSPLSDGKTPLLGLDVWEHAYYILYNYRRADYIKNFWKIINWQKVDENYQQATK
jgi:Fe-Mn family superoxide dismutase